MNQTEKRFLDYMSRAVPSAEIFYEAITFKLGPDCRYTPDFSCWVGVGLPLVCYEVKGAFIRDDAMAKLRVAAGKFHHITFKLAQWKDGKWSIKTIVP